MRQSTREGLARLQEVLDAPVPDGRDPIVTQLAEERAEHGPPEGIIVKQVAVAAPDAETDTEATGAFSALVSTWDVDRQGDRFMPGAWDGAIEKIRKRGRPLPLLFGHDQNRVSSVIGAVAPGDVWTDDEGLHIKGWIDTSDSLGKRLFRMVKRGVLSWSVGFSLANSRKTADGVRELLEVGELYEISAVVTPANEATRTTGAKRDAPSVEELKQWERELGLDPEFERVRASARDRC